MAEQIVKQIVKQIIKQVVKQKAEQTLEQELETRIFKHKVAVAGGVLMQEYIEDQLQGSLQLPKFQVEEMADEYSDKVIKRALADGTFEDLYTQAWDKIKYTIPENMKIPC